MFRAQLRRLLRDNRGNVALMFAASLFPLSFLIGMGIDYTMASDRQAQLNGFADAAALAAVTPTMMAQADSVAKTAATSTFNAQAQQLNQITYTPSNLTVSVSTDSTGKRTATVAIRPLRRPSSRACSARTRSISAAPRPRPVASRRTSISICCSMIRPRWRSARRRRISVRW